MALNSTLFRGNLQVADTDNGRYETLSLSLAQHPSETKERVVARLLAYALSYEPELNFSKGICDGDTPDILLQPLGEKMRRWIEVGEPAAERLLMAARKADQVTLFLYSRHPWRWERHNLEKVQGLSNLSIWQIPMESLDVLTHQFDRGFDWALTLSGGVIYLNTGTETVEVTLTPLQGSTNP